MNKFKVGDKVRIKTLEEMLKTPGVFKSSSHIISTRDRLGNSGAVWYDSDEERIGRISPLRITRIDHIENNPGGVYLYSEDDSDLNFHELACEPTLVPILKEIRKELSSD